MEVRALLQEDEILAGVIDGSASTAPQAIERVIARAPFTAVSGQQCVARQPECKVRWPRSALIILQHDVCRWAEGRGGKDRTRPSIEAGHVVIDRTAQADARGDRMIRRREVVEAYRPAADIDVI